MLAFDRAQPGAWFGDRKQQLSSTLLQAGSLGIKAIISPPHKKIVTRKTLLFSTTVDVMSPEAP